MRAKAEQADLVRCPWIGIADPIYARYHDEEWGVPKADDRALFEKLVLEGFQAGLSWLTILKKRENFRRAFHGFEPARIARYGAKDIARLMADPGIVRNRLKIEATIDNARALLALQKRTSLASFLWAFVDGSPQTNRHTSFKTVPAETPVSKAISKALKAEGFRFVGPTTIYAFMQSTGMVNDHLIGCHRHGACAELQRRFKAPAGSVGARPLAPELSERRNVEARGLTPWPKPHARRAPGSACCRVAVSICSIRHRRTSRSRTSPMAWPASRAGMARRSARTRSRSPSTPCWSRRSPPPCTWI